jgi:hypothetical protein
LLLLLCPLAAKKKKPLHLPHQHLLLPQPLTLLLRLLPLKLQPLHQLLTLLLPSNWPAFLARSRGSGRGCNKKTPRCGVFLWVRGVALHRAWPG